MIASLRRPALTVCAIGPLVALLVGASPGTAPLLSPVDVQQTDAGNSPYLGSRVSIRGIVTGVSPDGLFYYVADPIGGEWSGVKVLGRGLRRRTGEGVSVTGEVTEFYGETRIREWSSRGHGDGVAPEPTPIGVIDLISNAERWEGVLVRIDDVQVVGTSESYGEFPITDASTTNVGFVDDEFHTWYVADPGDTFESITGIVSFGWGDYLVQPRSDADLVGWTSGRGFDAEVRFRVVDGQGVPMPCKVTFFPDGATPLRLGPDDRAEGSEDVAYLANGEGTVPLPSGGYDLVISRGIEYSLWEQNLTVTPGASPLVSATLVREVDTSGWISGDFHLHSAPSTDSPVPLSGRILTLAGEGVEWGIATDHNRVTDYAPVIERLGLGDWVTSSVGQEITTRIFGHFNAWPLEPGRQPIPWEDVTPDGLFATAHADPGSDIVQVNHPVVVDWGNQYFQIYAVSPFTGEPENAGFSFEFDALEVMNGGWIDQGLGNLGTWMRMLNSGHRITATGNSDSHHVVYAEPGYPRNFVASIAEPGDAREDDLVQAVLDGRVFVSYGPIVGLSANGVGLGGLASAPAGSVTLDVRVQSASWFRASTATLYANADPIETIDLPPGEGPQDFTHRVMHQPKQDTWYLLLVDGGGDLAPVRRSPWFRPLAFTNPVRVDVDGNGEFDPPGNFANALSVAEAREVDASGIGTRLGDWTAVEGCATTETRFGTGASGVFYIQDATGGIQIREELGPITEVRPGDLVRAGGIVSQVLGEAVLADATIEVALPGPCPTPIDIVTGDVGWTLEPLEGSLVRVSGVNVVSGSWPQGGVEGVVNLDDGSGSVPLVIPPGVVVPPEAADLADFGVTALLTQRDFSAPYQSGYRLTLRSADDLEGLAGVALAAEARIGVVFGRPRPNPFRTELTVPVYPRPGEPLPGLVVHDVAGRVVRRLTAPSSDARSIVWDGRDSRGAAVGSGVYFLRLLGAGGDRTIRVVKVSS